MGRRPRLSSKKKWDFLHLVLSAWQCCRHGQCVIHRLISAPLPTGAGSVTFKTFLWVPERNGKIKQQPMGTQRKLALALNWTNQQYPQT